jgi:translation elongation factor EF-1alpha
LDQYQSVCAQLQKYLGKIGYTNVVILPVDSVNGYNIISSQPCGFQVNAPSLIDAFNSLTVPKRFAEKPLECRLSVAIKDRLLLAG